MSDLTALDLEISRSEGIYDLILFVIENALSVDFDFHDSEIPEGFIRYSYLANTLVYPDDDSVEEGEEIDGMRWDIEVVKNDNGYQTFIEVLVPVDSPHTPEEIRNDYEVEKGKIV